MRHSGIALLMTLVAIAGCAPGSGDHAPAPASRSAEALPQRLPPFGSHGKIAADQVGKVSPVPAFEGGAADWRISIHATGGMRHGVRLSQGSNAANGTARYRKSGMPGMHALDGTLYSDRGDRAMHITLQRGNCSGADGRVHPYGVEVLIDGMTPLQGCGDLALQ